MNTDVSDLEEQADEESRTAVRNVIPNSLPPICGPVSTCFPNSRAPSEENFCNVPFENSVIVKITNPSLNTRVHISFEEPAAPLTFGVYPTPPYAPPPLNIPDLQNLAVQAGMPVQLSEEQRRAQSQPSPVPTQPIPPCAPAVPAPPLAPPLPFQPPV